MQVFENFISYRRKDASVEVKMIYDALIKRGYTTFCDVYSLKSGNFDENLKGNIDKCINFILVISQNSIKNCSEIDDWLYKEIHEAFIAKKNIICVFLGDVIFPDVLPEGIKDLKYQNGLKFDIIYFESFVDKLISQFFVSDIDLTESDINSEFLIEQDTLIKYLGNAKTVSVPEGIKYIGDFAFKDKTNIEKINFPISLLEIGESTFERCLNISFILLPENLTKIGRKAFNRCFNVSYIQLNEKLLEIGDEAFGYCNKIKTININSGLEKICSSAFNNCSQLAAFNVANENNFFSSFEGLLLDKELTTLFRCPEAYRSDLVHIPTEVETIEKWAFYKCYNILDISLPRGLKTVCAYAFKDCYNISRLTIYENILEFDVSALDGWSERQQVIFGNKCNQLIKYNITKKLKENKIYTKPDITDKFILVKTTFESRTEAEDMARMLIDKHLIVSGQISRLHSIYMWDDQINSEDEVELSCITASSSYSEVEDFIKTNHSYEVCEILCIPIIKTTPEFTDWILSYVKKN